MESWKCQPNMSEMTIALRHLFEAGFATCSFSGDALTIMRISFNSRNSLSRKPHQSWIQGSILDRCSVFLDIIEHAIRDLDNGLIDNVLVRPES
jgi:hypothetical protein